MAQIPTPTARRFAKNSTSRDTKRETNRGEEIEQARVIKWSHKAAVRALMPELKWLHHSPNGGVRTPLAGAQMKALGVKKGFPDLILPVLGSNPFGPTPGLVIEMKSAVGRLSPEQNEWIEHLSGCGWICRVARSAQEARSHLCQYLGITPEDAPELD